MEIERRERDPDTGEMAPSEAGAGAFGFGSLVGEGFGDVIGKIAAKLTGKTAKKLATKAAEKLVEKELKKLEKKLVNLLVKKFMINFQQSQAKPASSRRSSPRNKRKRNWENACCFIPSCKPTGSFAPEKKATERKFQKINNVYADLL